MCWRVAKTRVPELPSPNGTPDLSQANRVETMAEKLANAAPVELPPMVKESHQYRCKDNNLIFVDFMSDDKTVNVRTEKDGAPTKLTAAEAGKPFEGGGFKVEGTGKQITATLPGKSALSCKA